MNSDLIIYEIDAELIEEELIETFDGVINPGGIKSPDNLRRSKKAVDFVKAMNENGKLVAAFSYAGWILISAKLIDGRKVTSFYTIRHDMKRSGLKYENFLKTILDFLK